MIDELTEAVRRAAGLTPQQARLAVAGMLRFFTARLPSALLGELHTRLQSRTPASSVPSDNGMPEP